jgi:tetratricopeptide (TPR) repeat protein
VRDGDGHDIIAWQPEGRIQRELPNPATELLQPAEIESVEELYLAGLHLAQYRHATRSPEDYWREGLARDPENAQLNNAVGLVHLRKGEFTAAEDHFVRAVRRLTFRNPNPYDGEAFYNLGLARYYQGKNSAAYEAFYKATWNYAWQSAGNYALACISMGRGDAATALEQVESSLLTNHDNLKARALKAALLRRAGRKSEAQVVIDESLALDRLDFRMMAERYLLSGSSDDSDTFVGALKGDVQTLLDVSFDLAWAGLPEDAYLVLKACAEQRTFDHPMVWYTLSWLAVSRVKPIYASEYLVRAEAASTRYCFPARLEEMIVLKSAIARNPSGARAHYYLGNLFYDKRRYDDAIRFWRRAVELDKSFSIPWRNLGIAEFNILHDPRAAERMYENAFAANPDDARLLYEWDQLQKRAGLATPGHRLRRMEQHSRLVAYRDDLTVEYATLLNQAGRYGDSLSILTERCFSPWEGGEGLASAQYVYAQRALGVEHLQGGNGCEAVKHFEAARTYPHNLGEGKHLLTLERDLDYLSGLAARQVGNFDLARKYWYAAAAPLPEPGWHSYFQARALTELGEFAGAEEVLANLARFAEEKNKVAANIDYFATSLPNLLLFEDDLEERKRVECQMLSALAKEGLGKRVAGLDQLREVTNADPNHLPALFVLHWIAREGKLAMEEEVRPAS